MPDDRLTITPDGTGRVTLRKGFWSMTILAADLASWEALYRRLWARKPGKPPGKDITPGPFARFYEDDLRAIERARRET